MNINVAGQTINDRLLAARHSLAGQGLAKSVCKATTEELIGPKKKHLDYLVHCTNEPNVSIPHLANLLVERTQNTNWVVVYKALITVHHLLAYGNERFMQYLASSNSTFNLSNFLDKGGVQGTVGARIGYDMSPFIRRYAKYLNEKAMSYRTVAFDFCKMKRGKEEGTIRSMNADKLLKTLPVLQGQLDALLEFDCTANDLTNGVISTSFTLLFRDLIRLFACYNDGIINMLEKYFDMNKKQCRDALDLYKRFLVRMDRVGEFLKVAENMGMDKGELPDLTKAPSSLLDALEAHLGALEGKKGSAANTPTQSAASNQKNIKSGVSALSSTSSSFGTAAASTRFENNNANGIDEALKAQALAEEEAIMNQYKSKVSSPGANNASTNPFLASSPAGAGAPIVDLFDSPHTGGVAAGGGSSKASDDLLQLGNPFADMFGPTAGAAQPGAPLPMSNPMWMGNGVNGGSSANTFVSDSNFSSVFGNTEPAGYSNVQTMYNRIPSMSKLHAATEPNPFFGLDSDVTGGIIPALGTGDSNSGVKPMRPPPPQGFDALGDVLKPGGSMGDSVQMAGIAAGAGVGANSTTAASGKVLTGELDSSLASLAENLTINKSASAQVKGVQWNSPKNAAKPGAANWQPQPMAATTGAGYRPMAQGMTVTPAPSTFYPSYPQYLQQGMGQVRPPLMAGAAPMGVMPGQPPAMPPPPQQAAGTVQLDPFGAM